MMEKRWNAKNLITLQELAAYLQIKERTLYSWAQRGKIPGFKLGNVWRFKMEDIESWIAEHKRGPSRP